MESSQRLQHENKIYHTKYDRQKLLHRQLFVVIAILFLSFSFATGKTPSMNGFALTYHSETLYSSVHCVGETFQSDAFKYRSCQVTNLCYDTALHEFVLYPSSAERELIKSLLDLSSVSTLCNTSVTLHSVGLDTIDSIVPWSPRVEAKELTSGYYQLPENLLWVPFQAVRYNTTSLIWDNLYPIYTLLSIFDLDQKELVITHMNAFNNEHNNSCGAVGPLCQEEIDRWLPIIGLESAKFTANTQLMFTGLSQSSVVCATTGAYGIGFLSNLKTKSNFFTAHTHGRGAILRKFRDFLARQLGGHIPTQRGEHVRVLLMGGLSETRQLSLIETITEMGASVEAPENFDYMTPSEQTRMVSTCTIVIATTDAHILPALFLPSHSTIIHVANDVEIPSNDPWKHIEDAGFLQYQHVPEADYSLLVSVLKETIERQSYGGKAFEL